MGSFTTTAQKSPGQTAERNARNLYVEIAWAGILSTLLAGLYSTAAGITLWIAAILLAALLFLPTKPIQMRAVDWSVLLLAAFEIPSLLSSQYRANSIREAVAIAIFALIYCAARLAIRSNLQVAVFTGLLGLGGGEVFSPCYPCIQFLAANTTFPQASVRTSHGSVRTVTDAMFIKEP